MMLRFFQLWFSDFGRNMIRVGAAVKDVVGVEQLKSNIDIWIMGFPTEHSMSVDFTENTFGICFTISSLHGRDDRPLHRGLQHSNSRRRHRDDREHDDS